MHSPIHSSWEAIHITRTACAPCVTKVHYGIPKVGKIVLQTIKNALCTQTLLCGAQVQNAMFKIIMELLR